MNKLQRAGWSMIPVAAVIAVVGYIYQERAGGMAKSPEAKSAVGAFFVCLGAAGILLTADSHRRGLLEEEDREVVRKDRPIEFGVKIAGGYLFWALFLIVGIVTAIRA